MARCAARAAEALAATFRKNLRIFTLITNTLAKDKEISDRWRGFEDIADSRHLANRVERSVVDALALGRSRRLSAPVTPLLRDEGALARHGTDEPLGPQRAVAGDPASDDRLGRGKNTVLSAYQRFSPDMAEIARIFFDRNWIDAPVRPASRRAPSRIRPCRRRIPMSCSTTWASRAT